MKTLRLVFLVLVCSLRPIVAHADDGGWIEWLEKWSGPKLVGIGSQIHLLCRDADGTTRTPHAPFENRGNIQFVRNGLQICVLTLEVKG